MKLSPLIQLSVFALSVSVVSSPLTYAESSTLTIKTEIEEASILLQTELNESRSGYGLDLNLNRVLSDLENTIDDYQENMGKGGDLNAEEAIRMIAREVSVLIQTIGNARTGNLAQKGLHRVQITEKAISPLERAFTSFVKEVSKKDIEVIAFSKSIENKRANDKQYNQYEKIMSFYAGLAQDLKNAADTSRQLLLSAKESWDEKRLKSLDADEEMEIESVIAYTDDILGPLDRLYTRIGWTRVSTDAVQHSIAQEEVIKSKFLWFGEKVVLKNPTNASLNQSLDALRQAVSETMVAFGMALMEVKDTQVALDYRAEASKAAFSVFTRLAEKISQESDESWNYTAHKNAMLDQIDEVVIPAAEDLMNSFNKAKKEVLLLRQKNREIES